MLEPLFNSVNRERVLLFLYGRQEGYAREIARFFNSSLDPIQKQLEKLEFGGIIYGRSVGRTRLYAFNPRYPFLNELNALLEKAVSFLPVEERENLIMNRRRPRRKGKPL
ncbi:MAG: ArsR family transcriptional regulator [Candidatus Latescibacteria bacterium]|nr:ArsR family transcriptional regulator [Candidatus Latescibacterota bacterium]